MIDQLRGTWALEEYLGGTSGSWTPVLAEVTGRLVYSPGAQMAAVISGLTPEGEFYQVAYAGTVSLIDGCVHHQVATATRRGFLGQTLVRRAELTGDILVLTTITTPTHRLTWRRIKVVG